MDYPKSVPGVGLVDGKFVDENPVTGQVGSLIPSSWGVSVTDEILNVIRGGGLDPAEAEFDQLVKAIRAIVQQEIPEEEIRTTLEQYGITDAYTKSATYSKAQVDDLLKNLSALPIGALLPMPKSGVPAGFLELDGSVKSTATYPDLSAYLGTTFNTGNEGAGNFRLPDSRGEFLRGWDHGRGVDAGRAAGSTQADAFQNFTATLVFRPGVGVGNGVVGAAGGAASVGLGAGGSTNTVTRDAANSAAADNITINPSAVARTSTETRPRNLAVMWCIKAWDAPVNQGVIDVGALAAEVYGFSTKLSLLFKTSTDVKASRVINVGYTNERDVPIAISIGLISTALNQTAVALIDGKSVFGSSQSSSGLSLAVFAIVPAGGTYKIPSGSYTLNSFLEFT